MTDSKIRVLIGANDLVLAGVQRLVIEQLQGLDRSRFDVALVILRQFPGKETFDDLIPADVRVYRLDFGRLLDVSEWIKLIGILRRERPRVVKTATFFSNALFLTLRPLFGYRVIAAEHNTVAMKPRWQRAADRWLFARAFTIVADSKQVADFVAESEGIPREKFSVVYNGVDLARIEEAKAKYAPMRASIRKEHDVPEDAFVFFTVARLVKQKNHVLMVEAFARVREAHPEAFLVIAGDGALRQEIEARAAELGVKNAVVMLGEQKNIYRYYAASDAFLLTSRHEGFCIAAMEGLAFGMPLISTKVAGVSEYLKDSVNGYFTEHNAVDIAEKMTKVLLMSDEEVASFSRAGIETAGEYSIERYRSGVNELLLSAAR
ncbi:MAG: glycosyltransferase [Candidatus Pacebacteria bacterium]|nr:glycosyltransferase [Candidatus Paceibacterota bacterium]MBP9840726.1 glycosyltransferase [Candidatus Paceibacterota bacterium]